MSRTRFGAAVLAAALAAAITGCTSQNRVTPGASSAPRPDTITAGGCLPGPTAAATASAGTSPANPSADPAFAPGQTAGRPLPEIALPCLDGSGTVQLGRVTGPVVINLWASWCTPCLTELPALQRYAQRAKGQLTVVGVDTADTRDGGRSIVERLGLTFPNLYDARSELRNAMDGRPLPMTLFVDAEGTIVHLYNSEALDEAAVERLVEQHLGVVVPE